MRFIYRGIKYDQQPDSVKMLAGEISGKYRGQAWSRNVAVEERTPQPMYHLKYRGVSYTIGEIETARTQPIEAAVPSGAVLSSLMPQVSRLHRANLKHNIEHRLEVAKAQGNATLVSLLEREFDEVVS